MQVSGFFTVARLWLPEQWQYWAPTSEYQTGCLGSTTRLGATINAQDRKSSDYNHRAVNDVEDAIEALRSLAAIGYATHFFRTLRGPAMHFQSLRVVYQGWVRNKFFSESLLPLGIATRSAGRRSSQILVPPGLGRLRQAQGYSSSGLSALSLPGISRK